MNVHNSSNDADHEFFKSGELSVKGIKEGIQGSIGRKIFFCETVSSTNTIAAELAEKDEVEGAVVIADRQERGRGRLGRCWVSPPGVNIYMSILLRPEIEPKHMTLITIMDAIACTLALRRVTGLNVTIKWPNDLMVSDKKLGGILTEMRIALNRTKYAVTGIGINVNMDSDALPDIIKDVATSVKMETGMLHSRPEIIIEILNEIDHWYRILKEKRKMELLSQWKELTSTLGRKVKIILGKETLTGVAESIDSEGMLVVKLPSGASRVIRDGDLTILR
ncbi:MAG TPA: biotin--[acetyl-CoA-carboxylase] ligase [Thermodesulfovibrionales bacterium]|nr:biotin--[acetyl-CoA-carboxylase] ligase [Thermodesulfovibrionales bacterium]